MEATQALPAAIQRHEQYLRLDPDNLLLQIDLGDLYHRAGRLEDAAASFGRVLEREPGHAVARGRQAAVLMSQHRFAEAEALLADLIAEGDPAPALQHNLGLCLHFQQRWEDAVQCFAAAAEGGLHQGGNYLYWIRSLQHLGRYEEAIEVGQRWVQAAGEGRDAAASRSCLSLLLFDSGDQGAARELAAEVLARMPDDPGANVVVGFAAVEQLQVEPARRHFMAALSRDANDPRAWQGLGLVHLYAQEHAQAVTAFEKVARITPKNLGNRVALGWTRLLTQDLAGAEQTFEAAIQVNRTFGESYGGLASAQAMLGKADEAERAIKLARKLDPNGFGAEFARAVLLANQGQQEAASTLIKQLLERAPREGMLPLIEQLRAYVAQRNLAAASTAPNT